MLKVGLTGSIAVGKTFVCEIFREFGFHVLDADVTAREVVAPGSVGLSQIVESFGPGVLAADGSLDRAALGEIVFADESKRQLLNSIVHPLVIREQDAWVRRIEVEDPDGVAIVDAALMIESGGYKRFDKLIVVWCDPELQLQRLMARSGLSEAAARRRIAAQMPQEEKKKYADFLIDTSGDFEETRRRTLEIAGQLKILVKLTDEHASEFQ